MLAQDEVNGSRRSRLKMPFMGASAPEKIIILLVTAEVNRDRTGVGPLLATPDAVIVLRRADVELER